MIGRVPAPTNLQFTEVTPESFRGTWDHGASDVSLYRITWAPVGNPDKMEVTLALSVFPFCPIFFLFAYTKASRQTWQPEQEAGKSCPQLQARSKLEVEQGCTLLKPTSVMYFLQQGFTSLLSLQTAPANED
jgi:hypothetical protein